MYFVRAVLRFFNRNVALGEDNGLGAIFKCRSVIYGLKNDKFTCGFIERLVCKGNVLVDSERIDNVKTDESMRADLSQVKRKLARLCVRLGGLGLFGSLFFDRLGSGVVSFENFILGLKYGVDTSENKGPGVLLRAVFVARLVYHIEGVVMSAEGLVILVNRDLFKRG